MTPTLLYGGIPELSIASICDRGNPFGVTSGLHCRENGYTFKNRKIYWKKRDFHDRMTGIIEENNGRAGGVRRNWIKKI